MRKYLLFILLLALQIIARGQTTAILDELGLPHPTTAKSVRYWFDDDANVMTCSACMGVQTLDVSSLIEGLHTLHYQVVDSNNEVSYIASRVFLKIGSKLSQDATASQLVYWFDDAENKTAVSLNSGIQMLDASSLLDGLHTLHYMVVCSDGSRTSAYSSIFLRMNIDIEKTDAHKLRYWFDEETALTEIELVAGVQTLDTSHLLGGLHTVHYQLIDERETSAIPVSGIFLKTAEGAGTVAQKLRYWFDDNTEVKTVDVMGCNYMLDVSTLLTGLHTLHYQIIDDKGNVGGAVSGLFMKQYDKVVDGSENVITHYTYWMNDNSADNHKVKIANPSSPYQLITLLPMIKAPIRSYSFHFEVKDEMPTVYAKNDLHIRFEDATGYWVDAAHSFVDYSVSKTIKDFSELKTSQTFARPEENNIKWFKFEAASGDTIAFKANQATSLQVFAPSGKEIYSASGDKSVKYGGAHTWEDGTYYVAVHDVTGSKSNVTLDYMHMDKYDVVSQDVRVVGNGGCSTITFHGNGFKDLYDVVLTPVLYSEFYLWDHNSRNQGGYGDTIHAIAIDHISDSEVAVTFDFSKIELPKKDHESVEGGAGSYRLLNIYCSAKFNFTEGEKYMHKSILVERPKYIELATKVTYPSTFLRGTTTTYTVEITNKGNMTAYQVPLMVGFRIPSIEDITALKIDGIEKLNYIDAFDLYDFEDEDKEMISDVLSKVDDISQFIIVKDSIDGMDYGYAHLLVSISPNSKKQILFEIKSTSSILLKAYSPGEWNSVKVENNTVYASKSLKASARNSLCCTKEKYQCAITTIADVLGIVGGGVNCGAQIISNTVNTSFDIACSDGGTPYEKIGNYLSNNSTALAGKVINTAISCVLGNYIPILKNLREEERIARMIGNASEIARITDKIARTRAVMNGMLASVFNISTTGLSEVNCFTLPLDEKPDCPPNPRGGGGSSNSVNSLDPNDIYGYIASSGSMYVGDDVLNLPYRIEFENDTTFATASAHTVIVKDTLDAKVFDLSSYQPTSIKIGDKSVQLKGDKTFVTTVDMRPEINAIAQVEGLYDEKKGIATWQFTSLDPMTMESTDDIMQGFLPVNYDGSGIGEVAYNINRKAGLSDGTAISNKASIVFDSNDAIETPVWTNIIDAIPPVTHVSDVEQVNDTIVRVHFDGEDNSSGIWKYALYVQYGENTSWNQVAENDTICFDFRFYKDINYGFCVVATDYAGNVEKKIIQREYKFLNGEGEKVDGISSPYENQVATNKAYDLNGRLIQEEGYNGIIIKNRKKLFKR